MLDLETLGSRPGCAILSIGAVAFDPMKKELGPEFYTVVNRASCKKLDLHEDQQTLAWWRRQSPEAREVLSEADSVATSSVLDALAMFQQYMLDFSTKCRVWGCGADFDNAILAHIYAQAGMKLPWKYTNSRCHRTLKNMLPMIKIERSGIHHNALDDAKHQAKHAMELLDHIGGLARKLR